MRLIPDAQIAAENRIADCVPQQQVEHVRQGGTLGEPVGRSLGAGVGRRAGAGEHRRDEAGRLKSPAFACDRLTFAGFRAKSGHGEEEADS
jgi:hypothetical protein